MNFSDYISNAIKPFTLETMVSEVELLFNETSYSHFPIVDNDKLIGLIAQQDVEGIDESPQTIGHFEYLLQLFYTNMTDSLLESLSVFALNETNIIPVVNAEKEYVGFFDLFDILNLYSKTPFLKNLGIVLLLEKETEDFSFSQICQIIESSGGKIDGMYMHDSNSNTIKTTVKFNASDVNVILQAFRRYNYRIISNHKEDFYLEDLKERSKYFQKYLNI